MKRVRAVLLVFATLLLVFTLARSAAIVSAAEQPALVVEANHELGRVPVGQARTMEIRLTNMGNAELLLSVVKSSCECSIVTLPSKAVSPGGIVPLKVTITPKKPGKRQSQILIRSNDPVHPVTVLTISSDAYTATGTGPTTRTAGRVERVR